MGRTKGAKNKKTLEREQAQQTMQENVTPENTVQVTQVSANATTNTVIDAIPLGANVRNVGFNPDAYAEKYEDGTPFLPVRVQMAWFRLIYPEGYIQVDTPQIPPRCADDTYWTKATVYAGPGMVTPLADASVQRGPSNMTAMEMSQKIDFFSAVQTSAIGEALKRAGFWLSYTKEEHLIAFPKKEESADVAEEATAEVTAEKAEEVVEAVSETPADVAEEATVEATAEKAEEVVEAVSEAPADVVEEATAEAIAEKAEEVVEAVSEAPADVAEEVTVEATAEKAEEVVEAVSEAPTDVVEEATAEATAEKAEEVVEAVSETPADVVEEATVEETEEEPKEKTLTEEELKEIEELRAVPFSNGYYNGSIGDLEEKKDTDTTANNLIDWLLASNMAKRKNPQAVAAVTRLAELAHPDWFKNQ